MQKESFYYDPSNTTTDWIYATEIAQPEQGLWRAVILQAIIDACSESSRTEDQVARSQARDWLLEDSKDFHAVVQSAGWSPHYVRTMAAEAIAHPEKWRRTPPNKKQI